MAITVTKQNGNTTFKWEITGPSITIDPFIDMFAKAAWHIHGVLNPSGSIKSFALATNNEKFAAATGVANAPKHDLTNIS